MGIEHLDWDSVFFGINIGKQTVGVDGNFDPTLFKEQSQDEGYDLVYVAKRETMLDWQTIIEADLKYADTQITLVKRFNADNYTDIFYDFRTELNQRQLKDCYRIAEETAVVSRFYAEAMIGPERTRALYRKWIDTALDQSFSDGLFISQDSGSVSGVHLVRTDKEQRTGRFTLTGVNPTIKGKGIGAKLWTQSFGYFARQGDIDFIKSPFSFQNTHSFNLHLKMGFDRIDETTHIYHFCGGQ